MQSAEPTDVLKAEFERARAYLAGRNKLGVKEALALARALRDHMQFALARRTAAVARADLSATVHDQFELLRVEVTSTYKDLALPPDVALPRALRLLSAYLASHSPPESLDDTTDCELLALAGAVHKRWWEYDQRQSRLEQALAYYQRAYGYDGVGAGDPTIANGYPAINAAFVLDQLAALEFSALVPSSSADAPPLARIREATSLRARVADALRPRLSAKSTDYWTLATAAEAFLGIGHLEEATAALRAARERQASEWELESTTRQLAALARLGQLFRGGALRVAPSAVSAGVTRQGDPVWAAVRDGLGAEWTEGVATSFAGKFGVALSGGGFRAALYHIGVLARLAELDLLRRVEVLSCVSGGSIIGARYYLEVRRLLETKSDDEITAEDYRQIVGTVEAQFLEGVQQDVRNQLLADVPLSLRVLVSPTYSRTHGLGRLLERTVLSPGPPPTTTNRKPVSDAADLFISSLYIAPRRAPQPSRAEKGEHSEDPFPQDAAAPLDRSQFRAETPQPDTHDTNFNPRLQNWRRRAKVPILILNATTLNTGHPWQFTASWMGEPASAFDARTSATPRMLQVRYADAPPRFQRVRLGEAVAASAAVPGVFDPLPLDGLYADGVGVRLVDGGVHDNQGIGGLLDQNCTVLLISDASGQLTVDGATAGDPYNVSKRANDVLMSRVRETQMQLLRRMSDAGILRAVVHSHLRLDLQATPIASAVGIPPGADGDEDYSLPAANSTDPARTRYGVRRDIASQLARIRTDLDAFHDLEADALMYVGYRATEVLLHETPAAMLASTDSGHHQWRFLGVEPLLTGRNVSDAVMQDVIDCLQNSRKVFGRTGASREGSKPWLVSAILMLLGLAWSALAAPMRTSLWMGAVVLMVLGAALVIALVLLVLGRVDAASAHRKSWWVRWGGLAGIVLAVIPKWTATAGRREYLTSGSRARWVGRAHGGHSERAA